jgi:predicted PurR-regulated permease PerM
MSRRRVVTVSGSRFVVLASVCIVVATLYLAQDVLIPVVLAVLFSFLLAPMVRGVQRMKLGRVPAVLLVVVIAFSLLGALGWVVGEQVAHLAENIPQYQAEIVKKMRHFRGQGSTIADRIASLGREIERAGSSTAPTTQSSTTVTGPAGTATNPLYTIPLPSPRSPIKSMGDYLGLALGPLGTAAIVVVFVIFMLLRREDLRDRLIRLVSGGQYMVTTRALNDAGARISRYMLAQSLVNGSYGVAVAIGLWLIGLTLGHGTPFPNVVLWGLLCALLRFVPYVGPWVAAAFPVVLSLVVYPGFAVFGATVGMFVVLELLSNNVMEPWLYGASTGISTIAILVAAVFWTWLWGPVGLLLATPLTVCIVVLGKYVPQLKFLDVLLGDEPALPPYVSYYQRLLAGDREEAAGIVLEHAKSAGVERVPDDVLIPALLLTRRDRERTGLSAEDETFIYDATREVLDRWRQTTRKTVSEAPTPGAAAGPASRRALVLGYPSHHRSEELVLNMLGPIMDREASDVEVLSTRLLPVEIESRVRAADPAVVFIAVLPPGGLAQARYLCTRLRERFPTLLIVVGYWGRARNFDRLLVRFRTAGASYVTTSLLQARSQIRALLDAPATPPPAAQPLGAEVA